MAADESPEVFHVPGATINKYTAFQYIVTPDDTAVPDALNCALVVVKFPNGRTVSISFDGTIEDSET